MADPLITVQDLIDRYEGGAEALREFAGDDGTGSYAADKVTSAIAGASDEAYGILLGGFGTNERVQALAANDTEVKDCIAVLVRHRLTRFKNAFRLPDGRSVFAGDAREARDTLRFKSTGAKRSSAESSTAGQSGLLRPRARGGSKAGTFTNQCGKPVGF